MFAYSRISPDGRYLAYASQATERQDLPFDRSQLQNVVDLATKTVIFREPGIDGYWSVDGSRMIYLSTLGATNSVSIWTRANGSIARGVAPESLGDYFSWGRREGRDLVLTILNRYYYLNGDEAELPAGAVPSCAGMGTGQRPLLSKDGRRVTTFMGGAVVVRNLTDCADVWNTGLTGAKADFSYDGRHVAFHAPKSDGMGYAILVVDIEDRTVRTVTNFSGSSFFPSWTADGRLLFRYDGESYRGFVIASNVLSVRAVPISQNVTHRTDGGVPAAWSDIFKETPQPPEDLVLVLVWGTWSAHAPRALADLEEAGRLLALERSNVRIMMGTDPASLDPDVQRVLTGQRIKIERVTLTQDGYMLAEAHNQNPTLLLFRRGLLVGRRLGGQSVPQIMSWVATESRP